MAHLIDDIRRIHRFAAPFWLDQNLVSHWNRHAAWLWETLQDRSIPVLRIDNVSEYYFVSSSQDYWSPERDFPNLAPPFECFWLEFRFPKKIHSGTGYSTEIGELTPNGRTGCLVYALPPAHFIENFGEVIPPDTHWLLAGEVFIDYGVVHDRIEGPHGTCLLAVDAAGQVIGKQLIKSFAAPEHEEAPHETMRWLYPALLAISFMHCKNVTITDNPVPPKLAKRFQERHGFEPTAHKTLVIEPLKEVLRKEGKADKTGLKTAMHICRGHFADYTEGKGLFGKYHGRYWMPQTIRGTKGTTPAPREIEIRL